MDALLKPFWEGDQVLNETVLPLRGRDGALAPCRLLFRASGILSVRPGTLEKTYVPGRDYVLKDGCLAIPEGSAIPVMDYDDYYPQRDDGACFPHSEEGFIRFGEGATFHARQIAVSYRHEDRWDAFVPREKTALLPRTVKLLQNGQPFKLLIFGDSICTGLNSSGTVGAPPYQNPWFGQVREGLSDHYGNTNIELINTSVGGKTSVWGRETAGPNAAAQKPDLCVIGFGMNDGSGNKPPEVFIENLCAIMDAVTAQKPECEFILIATTLANPEVKGFAGCQESYLAPMLKLERTGLCVADMTTLHKELLRRKPFRDLTGNNVNHPNDFLSRAYAQVLLRTLGAV